MWIYRPEDDQYFPHMTMWPDENDVVAGEIYFDHDGAPSPAQGAMFAEALNVHEQTGLTPAQLQARVADLEGALAAEFRRGYEPRDAEVKGAPL